MAVLSRLPDAPSSEAHSLANAARSVVPPPAATSAASSSPAAAAGAGATALPAALEAAKGEAGVAAPGAPPSAGGARFGARAMIDARCAEVRPAQPSISPRQVSAFGTGQQPTWNHWVMRRSPLSKALPSRKMSLSIFWLHFLHVERFDCDARAGSSSRARVGQEYSVCMGARGVRRVVRRRAKIPLRARQCVACFEHPSP